MCEAEWANGAAGRAVVGGQNAGFEGSATHTLSSDGGSERLGTTGKMIIREKRKALAWKVIEEVEDALEKSEPQEVIEIFRERVVQFLEHGKACEILKYVSDQKFYQILENLKCLKI